MAKVQVNRWKDGKITETEEHRGFGTHGEAYSYGRGVIDEAERRGEQVTTCTSTHDD